MSNNRNSFTILSDGQISRLIYVRKDDPMLDFKNKFIDTSTDVINPHINIIVKKDVQDLLINESKLFRNKQRNNFDSIALCDFVGKTRAHQASQYKYCRNEKNEIVTIDIKKWKN
jgi:hypothetical protein